MSGKLARITPERLEKSLATIQDWEARYRLIIDLGKRLPEMPEEDRTEETFVEGCQSQVWLKACNTHESERGFRFTAWSDAHLVRGLIAILIILFNDKSPSDILEYDIKGFFERHGLGEHLTPGRSNGFFAMVGRIQSLAGLSMQSEP